MTPLNLIHSISYLEVASLIFVMTAVSLSRSLLMFFCFLHLIVFLLWRLRNVKRHNFGDLKDYLAPLDGKVVEIKQNTNCPYLDGVWKCISIKGGVGDSVLQYAPIEGAVVQEELIINGGPIFGAISWLSWFKFCSGSTLIVELKDMLNNTHCLVETAAYSNPRRPDWPLKPAKLSFPVSRASVIGSGSSLSGNLLASLRTNLYVPVTTNIQVHVGQTMVAGETVVARELDRILLSEEKSGVTTQNKSGASLVPDSPG